MNYVDFCGKQISNIFKGNWQLAGGHGEITSAQAIDDLFAYIDSAGINVLDTADIYGDSEIIIGEFLKEFRKKITLLQAMKLGYIPNLSQI